MKIVRFLGGLGNQMFQYAFYKALERKFGSVAADLSGFDHYDLHNGFELEKIFPITLNKAHPFVIKLYDPVFRDWHIRKFRRLLNLKNAYYEEREPFQFDASIFKDKQKRLYWGYWQSVQYLHKVAPELREDFRFKLPLDERNQDIDNQIINSNSVAIHVRRGDYLHNELLGGICDQDYYQRAIDIILEKIKNPEFFIFSNDMAWCQSAFDLPNVSFVSWNHGDKSYVDMQLMSHCKHNIIANSSFSWWAAWLNPRSDKTVIAPANWTNNPVHADFDITPKAWLKI